MTYLDYHCHLRWPRPRKGETPPRQGELQFSRENVKKISRCGYRSEAKRRGDILAWIDSVRGAEDPTAAGIYVELRPTQATDFLLEIRAGQWKHYLSDGELLRIELQDWDALDKYYTSTDDPRAHGGIADIDDVLASEVATLCRGVERALPGMPPHHSGPLRWLVQQIRNWLDIDKPDACNDPDPD